MALRNKEALEKFFAESRERTAKRKEKESIRRKNFNKKVRECEKNSAEKTKEWRERREKKWVKKFISSIKNDSEWIEHWDLMDITIHAPEILEKLSDKNNLNDNEKKVFDFALALVYPNEFDIDQMIY